ncbi:MAG: ABC transporter ATP-binding protein [Magnetococcales bacterium]|nr:ABC transporter ATP-binding protein [Magnetococcales bacterium]
MSSSSEVILRTRGLNRDFGGVHALRHADLDVQRGKITGLIGPNGSGKTTFFQVVSGMDQGGTGSVLFNETEILGKRPSQIYKLGLARTFQLSQVFPAMTVLENLIVAGRNHDRRDRDRAVNLLKQVRMDAYADVMGSDLSYGQQRLVEFIRALMSEPSLLLLDEPAAGVNPTLRKVLWKMVRQMKALGTTVLIIEHDMHVIDDLCDEVYVLNEGEVIAQGAFETVREDRAVMEAYFGTAQEEN